MSLVRPNASVTTTKSNFLNFFLGSTVPSVTSILLSSDGTGEDLGQREREEER
jgi:hypothetical protein